MNKQEQLAGFIAEKIIHGQRQLANALNNRANGLSKSHQKWLLAVACVIAIGLIMLCLLLPCGKMAIRPQNKSASHIGLPSDGPIQHKTIPNDSLTIKK